MSYSSCLLSCLLPALLCFALLPGTVSGAEVIDFEHEFEDDE